MTTYEARIAMFKRRHGIGRARNRMVSPAGMRSYPGSATNRLTADWMPSTSTGDAEIRYDIQTLRDRSRQLERADPLMKRFLSCLEKNVLKAGVGFSLQNKAVFANGKPDLTSNQIVEGAFKEWSKKKNCTENGEESLAEVFRLALRSTARDGGVLIRKIVNPRVNDFGFALRMMEIDHLDINYNETRRGMNRVVMGVEQDAFGKTIAYWLLKKHPGDLLFGASPSERYRVPANEIIHYFVKERITQCVGVPWAAPSMLRMHHLEQYEISEIIASRRASNKGGFFTSERGDKYAGENEQATAADGTTEETGATIDDSEPGQYDELPPGMTFTPYDPTHPTQQYGDFTRDAKLGISAGLDMSYATLVGDLTKSSFSSMRTGWIDERETYKKIQSHMVEHLALEIFDTFLVVGMTNQSVRLPMAKFDALNMPNFRGRKWDFIDPQKDITALLMAANGGIRTRDSIIDESDSDLDYEETIAQLQYEKELADEAGLVFANPNIGGAPAEAKTPAKEPDDAPAVD